MRLITGGFVLVVLWMSLIVNSGEDLRNQEFFPILESQLMRDKEVLN